MDFFSGENLIALIKAVGYIGLFLIIFAESGLLIGFFLPGDSLLFTAGFLASQGYLNIYGLIVLVAAAAIIGDSVGYTFGLKVGPKIFKKEDSLLFHKDNLMKAEKFYEDHGPKTIVLARFIPFVRTFAPILAGVGKMHYKTFLSYNIIGGLLWAISIPIAGFFLGRLIPDIDKYLLPIILGIIVLSVAPSLYHLIRSRKKKAV
jgi:membrane-associated protein